MAEHLSTSLGYFNELKTLNVICWSCNLMVNSPFCTSIKVLPVAKNGLPKRIGMSLSASKSKIMKSARKMNLSTRTKTSSIFPVGCAMVLSAKISVTVVGLTCLMPKVLKTDKGIRLMLAPRSHRAFPISFPPMEQGIVKHPGSFSLGGNVLVTKIPGEGGFTILDIGWSFPPSNVLFLGTSSGCVADGVVFENADPKYGVGVDSNIVSTTKHKESVWVYKEGNGPQIEKKIVSYVPGLYMIVDDIFVSATNNMQHKFVKGKLITVENKRDVVPVKMDDKKNIYLHKLSFEDFPTINNYKNGDRVILANIFLKEFTIEIADVEHEREYKKVLPFKLHVFSNNMTTKQEAPVTECKPAKNRTRVSFKPDLSKFGMDILEDDIVALMKKRVVDVDACLLHKQDFIIEGGIHVEHIVTQIISHFPAEKFKILPPEPLAMKDNIWVFVSAVINNPSFQTETKEKLIITHGIRIGTTADGGGGGATAGGGIAGSGGEGVVGSGGGGCVGVGCVHDGGGGASDCSSNVNSILVVNVRMNLNHTSSVSVDAIKED
ncbi:LOW QUALITY PROTEIN: hypothetical protein OSB04_017445 [Centaurea solstitialis]|uniref:DNA topoisomerase (ATP-hydrolyzing) n=1 Tax=Centaurea solstitialis TaxID=347529 RepID=A0AA38WID0_9ASTR|nr:LOW QUALITY PROTEIN: hypothetical protein OSB04_017445 [Centaurea solstitialis]